MAHYDSLREEFNRIYQTTNSDPKIEYRYFCYRYLNYIRTLSLPTIQKGKQNEAVLIEFRTFPHLEFTIRNTIYKLGSDWSHTVVCGKNNYALMLEICRRISPEIKVINTQMTNVSQAEYSMLLTLKSFWNLFTGDKILIYQEDVCIFKSNIHEFLEWDYIGAPWPKHQNDNSHCVGNGGLSLRTKQCMLDVIDKISIHATIPNSSTLNYMKSMGLKYVPEDVYFSKNMIEHSIGRVADWESARRFSVESVYHPDSFGGHNFWIADGSNREEWKTRMYKYVVHQFHPMYDLRLSSQHRGGWSSVLTDLNQIDFFNSNSQLYFFDMMEKHFLWSRMYRCDSLWIGILHCTPKVPPYMAQLNLNIEPIFKNPSFIASLDSCLCIVSLSTYLTEYIESQLQKLNKQVKVYTLKHPVDTNGIIPFDFECYQKNQEKCLIHIGQQLRNTTSIYRLEAPSQFKKLWFTGDENLNRIRYLFSLEQNALKYEFDESCVTRMYISDYTEYDTYLSQNIVFLDLYDASANNAVLECIIRSTPVIVNRLPATEEYLGTEYPLFFETLDQVPTLLADENLIFRAHQYLLRLDKSEFQLRYFSQALLRIGREEISKRLKLN